MIASSVLAALLAIAGAGDPTALVDPFVGTAGTGGDGMIDDFPGASAPFGMVQWSPDTPTMPASGGYFYRDHEIDGFSLTHLSGAGCNVFGDFGVLPVTGEVANPARARVPFTHDGEEASPGFYAVTLGNGVRVALAATARAGFATFTFPQTANADLLVNVASNQSGVVDAAFHVVAADEIAGSATSGRFCGMPNRYTVYFDLRFDRPFAAHGTWNGRTVHAGAGDAAGTDAGGWVTFDASTTRDVGAKVAISYVSAAAARANLDAEPAQNLAEGRAAAANAWRTLLGEVRVQGGELDDRRMFYTSLYHALLSPTLYSDADGSYLGFDGRVHRDPPGHAEYANFSGWDIYRTQVPLMALLAPRETGDMMESLVHAAAQGGWLPKWPVANGYSAVMGGDSAEPILAAANAFGARNFDRAAALQAMVKNASDVTSAPGQGWYRPRPGLAEYLKLGYVTNGHTTDVSSVPNGTSETLEYALDDFAIAQFARALGRDDLYQTYARRSMNWRNVFDVARGLAAPRDGNGAFVDAPITDDGQEGFQEGNAAQYTWMVPQSEGSLIAALGGPAAAQARLDEFFSELNAGQNRPYAWLGNEPSLGSPWTYVYAGAPYKAQAVNRKAMTTLYAPTPDGLPGNDDLGTMSAWWVWNAIGLYPPMPGTPVLLLGAPLFPSIEIDSPSGRVVRIDAPEASRTSAYVQSLRVDGVLANRAWIRLPERGTVRLQFALGSTPNTSFASRWSDAPPSYDYGAEIFPPATTASLAVPAASAPLAPGARATLTFEVRNAVNAAPVRVLWRARTPLGFALEPSSGAVTALAQAPVAAVAALRASPSLAPGLYNVAIGAIAANGAAVPTVTAVVRVPDAAGALPPLGFVANYSEDTIVPIDPRTLAFGERVAVGSQPGAIAVTRDGVRAFVADQGSDDVSVVDTALGKTVARVKTGKIPAGLRFAPDGKTLWVTNYGDGTVQAIDAATLRTYAPIPVGRRPEDLAVAPDGSRVYVAVKGDNTVAVVDANGGKLQASIPVGDGPASVAISPDGSRLYVADTDSSDLAVVDAATHAILARIPTGKSPENVAISPDGSVVLVADAASSQVTLVDARTNAAFAIAVGNGPFAVAFAPGGRTAIVADSGDDECVLIDVRSRSVLGRIAVGTFPIAIGMPLGP